MTTDIFIKTYPHDYKWLEYCLRSIAKFATGFRQTVVVYDLNDGNELFDQIMKTPYAESISLVGVPAPTVKHGDGMRGEGYLWQQVCKLYADEYTDADEILYIDCDTVFNRPVTPETFRTDAGIIKWMMTPYEKTDTPWKKVIETFLGETVEFEFMRRFPFVVPRWLLAELRDCCAELHGISLQTYVMAQGTFSEFNAMGAFAYECYRDDFHWINTEEVPPSQWPEVTVSQAWSHRKLTAEEHAGYEEFLK